MCLPVLDVYIIDSTEESKFSGTVITQAMNHSYVVLLIRIFGCLRVTLVALNDLV